MEDMTNIQNTELTTEETTGKKGFFNNKKLIILLIAVFVLFIAAIVVAGSFVLPKTVTGTWELVVNPEIPQSTADEIPEGDRAYYVFEKPDRYGRGEYYTCYQGGVEYSRYELMEEASVKKINLGSADMEYRITGSKLLGNAKLTIIYPEFTDESTGVTYEAEEYIFEQAKSPKYEKSSYKDYDTDADLINKWISNERTLSYYYYLFSYTQTVEFTSDGIMVIRYESEDLGLDRYMYYAYTVKDSEITFSLVTDKYTEHTVAYEFDEDGNLEFIDDKTSDSIFADAFFGDFTFYTSENLPAPTQASADEMYLIE